MSSVIIFRSFNQPFDIIVTGFAYMSLKIDSFIVYSSISPCFRHALRLRHVSSSRIFIPLPQFLRSQGGATSTLTKHPFFIKKHKPRDPVGTDLCVH
jgi:hypothetical protein